MTAEALAEATGVPTEAVREAAALLAGASRKVLVFNRDYRGARSPHDVPLLAAIGAALGCGVLPLHEKANGQGLLDMGANPGWYPGYRPVTSQAAVEDLEKEWSVALRDLDTSNTDVAGLLRDGRIKAAIVLGEDPLGLESLPADLRAGLEAVECLVVADLFATATANAAHVVLPMSSTAETSGTFTNSERRVQQVRKAIPPRTGFETWQILAELAARMGVRFKLKYENPAEILEEIRRVAPIYRHVSVDSEASDGLWDAGRFPLSPEPLNGAATAPVAPPTPTASLDCLDARFEQWFKGLFKERQAAV
jgi:formate dehydrogenase alpha subunit